MQALIFLTTRSVLNGLKRAFTSGKRLVTLAFVLAYYGFLVFRPLPNGNTDMAMARSRFAAASPTVVDAVIFAAFGLMSLLLMIRILSPRGGFRQADVDVLFATPVSPRLVMFFRMIRDYLATLLTPLVFLIFGGRAGIAAASGFVVGLHADGPLVARVAALAWFLMSLTWVCLAYGLSFFVNRSDLGADRNKKIIDASVFVIVVGSTIFCISQLVPDPTVATAIRCTQSPLVRFAFFSGTAACWMVSGALHGQALFVAAGVSIFVGVAGLGIWMALTQVPFMYDQAAVKGFGSAERRILQRNSDYYGLSAQRARDGRSKVGRLSRWFGNLRFSGASVLIWKEILLQLRASPFIYLLLGSVQLVMVVGPVLAIDSDPSPGAMIAFTSVLFGMQALSVLMLTMNTAVSGFTELLKRVDFQKPLPFRPAGTVFWEVLSKCIPNLVIGGVASLLVVVLRPVLWGAALGSEVFVIGLSLVVSATVFLVTIAFSDAGDASQRGFRAILILFGIVICGFPGVGVLILLMGVLHLNPLLASVPATAINIAVALLVSFIAGGLYDSYNPSE